MIIIFQVLSVVLAVCLAVAWEFKFKHHEKANRIIRLAAISLVGIFAVRFLASRSSVLDPVGLSYLDFSAFSIALATLSFWFSVAVLLLVVIEPFYSTKVSKALVVYFAVPLAFFNLLCFHPFISVNYDQFSDGVFYPIIYCLENALVCALVYVLARSILIKEGRLRLPNLSREHWIVFSVAVLSILLLAATPNTFRALFGNGRLVGLKDLTQVHRLLIYSSVVIPIALYFVLRNRTYACKMQVLLYIASATLINFAVDRSFFDYLSLTSLPLHLCNTMLYIFLLSLVFKWNKLFYFNYFINVLGALLAMLMPDYADKAYLLSWSMWKFWTNHLAAFFMPLLCVAIKVFPRPNIKYFGISMIGFCVYFVFVLFVNAYNTATGYHTDFFFINSDYVAKELGMWAERLRYIVLEVYVGKYTLTFYPLYQTLFFLVYCAAGAGMWFAYNLGFRYADSYHQTNLLRRCIAKEEREFVLKMREINGDSSRFGFLRRAGKKGEAVRDLVNASELLKNPISPNGVDMIKITNFSKQYGKSDVFAVKDVSLEVHAGEIFGFLGPNGAGKSTIIKSLVGIQTITSGSIEVCGFDVERQSVQAKMNIGFVPDHYALYERLTGREYINYIADIYKVSQADRDARIDDYLERFELVHAFDNQMRTYSHGMKQKIAIMAALVHNPKVWILDEPLTGLDPNSIFQVKEVMRKHAENGNIVFFSSHIMDVVERLCHRFAVIKKGNIIARGTMDEIVDKGVTLEDYYLGLING